MNFSKIEEKFFADGDHIEYDLPEIYSINDFISLCHQNILTDDDGDAYYDNKFYVSCKEVNNDSHYHTVWWYNK